MCSGIGLGSGAGCSAAIPMSCCGNPFDQIHAPPKRRIATPKVTTSSRHMRAEFPMCVDERRLLQRVRTLSQNPNVALLQASTLPAYAPTPDSHTAD